ncbi:Pre-rRNA-processing protein ipi3 [Apophysomyces ossiformis]|uniref:Pre-rRNA-processing protein ipi3 n=1 Tax=Apophysomyces ossiformis TaxID=679940 RepID=A0A8H7BWJ7_9FUNG|nr:Pre-rRNA-processing protein ipi3 [Apophysomyces ossiformis]
MFMEVALSASSTDSTIYIWDIRSGSTIFSFKQNMCNKGGLTLVPRPGATMQTGAIVTAQVDRAVLNVYDWQRDQILHKMTTPEKMVSVTASHQGTYVAAATAGGRVYLWHIATGHLLRVFDAHYRRVTRLAFSGDDATLLTAGEDAAVNVWLVAHLLESEERPAPLYSWSDHTLPVSDLFVGHGGISSTRVYTSSLDHTVKLWDLATGTLLTTFLFPKPVSTVVLDPSETMLFAACEDKIYSLELYRRRQQQAYGSDTVESVGGLGKVEAVGVKSTVDERSSSSQGSVFSGHSGTITSLALSFDASILISSSEDGNCIVWDVVSRQPLRKFESHKGPVTHVACFLRPAELATGASAQKILPMPWKSFKRAMPTQEEEKRTESEHLIMNSHMDMKQHQWLVEAGPLYSSIPSALEPIRRVKETLRTINTEDSSNSLQSQITALQSELVRLHEHHSKVKSLHDEMYNTMVDEFMTKRRKRHLE